MDRIPRPTQKLHAITQEASEQLRQMMTDDIIHAAYESTVEAFRVALEVGHDYASPLNWTAVQDLPLPLGGAIEAYYDCRHTLVTLIRSRALTVARQWDDNDRNLEELIHIHICHRLDVELPAPVPLRVVRLSPDNPIERLGENIYYIPEDIARYRNMKHVRACLLELSGYLTALHQPHKPGRHKKSSSAQPQTSSRSDEDRLNAEADKAYAMSQESVHWADIARVALGIDVPPPSHRNRARRKAIAQLVSRRIERGRPEPENIPFSIRTRKKLPRHN